MIDLTNKIFDRLMVIEKSGQYIAPSGCKEPTWLCICECGNKCIVRGSQLRSGNTKSCGCLKRDIFYNTITKHNFCDKERLYKIWNNMRSRCLVKSSSLYNLYGGRNITVCKEWNSYLKFRSWALDNGYKEGLSLDRIDVNGNYEPDNCRWVTIKQQQNNKSTNHYLTYNNETHTMMEWSEIRKINYYTLRSRIRSGWNIGRALNYE